MSRLYKTVKRYYDKGIYDEADVATFVRAGKITPEEYELITGEPYEADNAAEVADVNETE